MSRKMIFCLITMFFLCGFSYKVYSVQNDSSKENISEKVVKKIKKVEIEKVSLDDYHPKSIISDEKLNRCLAILSEVSNYSYVAITPANRKRLLSVMEKDYDTFPSQVLASWCDIPEVLDLLATHPDWKTRARVSRNENASYKTLVKLTQDSKDKVVENLIDNEALPYEILEDLATHPYPDVRWYIAYKNNTQTQILEKILKFDSEFNDKNQYVIRAIASNRNITEEMVVTLFSFDDVATNFSLAQNRNTPLYILKKLAKYDSRKFGNDYVRWSVACNRKIDAELIGRFCRDTVNVKRRIALHPKITFENLKFLVSTADDFGMRRNIVENISVSFNTLKKLDKIHSFSLGERIGLLARKDYDSKMKEWLGGTFNEKEVRIMTKHPYWYLSNSRSRRFFQNIISTSPLDHKVFEALAFGENDRYKRFALSNPFISSEILTRVMESTDDRYVQEAVLANRNVTSEIIMKVTNIQPCSIATALAKNPQTPSQMLDRIVVGRNNCDQTLRHIVENPNVSITLLNKLKKNSEIGNLASKKLSIKQLTNLQ